jgi:hypothetical protein
LSLTERDGRLLWHCHAGCSQDAVATALRARGLLPVRRSEDMQPDSERKIVAIYSYRDESSALLFQVVRFAPKTFAQRRPDGRGGWIWDLNSTRRVLYRLREILDKQTVFVVEGEKDADHLWALGIPATTCPGGAGKWRSEYNDALRGKQVVILPDNDDVGEKHAQGVARALLGVAGEVKIVRLPGLPPKGDVSDWLDAGHSKDELVELVRNTPILKPQDLLPEQEHKTSNTPGGDKPLQWYTVAQLREETSAQVRYLVDGLLAESSLSVIGGKIAVGKSTLARTLAYCVTHGVPFLGRKTQQGAVLYVAPEESKHGVMQDLVALGFTDNDPLYLCFASSPDVIAQVRTKLQETQARLVIFETIFRVLRIKDANDYAQATYKLDPVLELARRTSAHVVFTHHLSKRDTTDALDALLGSTAIGGTPDTRIIIKKKGDVRTIEVVQRYGQPMPEMVLHYDHKTRFITPAGSKHDFDKQKVKDSILEVLAAERDGLTEKEINSQTEGRNALKREALREMVAQGLLRRDGKGGKSDPFRYALKDSCTVVPDICWGQENMNQKTELSAQETESYSCPHIFGENERPGTRKIGVGTSNTPHEHKEMTPEERYVPGYTETQ